MKCLFLIIVGFFCTICLFAQKPIITPQAIASWASLELNPKISNNGKYVSYIINNKPVGSKTLVLQSTKGKWQMEIQGGEQLEFSSNSKYVFYKEGRNNLVILNLDNAQRKCLANVSYFMVINNGSNELLCYVPTNESNTLVLRNFTSQQEKRYQKVLDKWLNEDKSILIVKMASSQRSGKQTLNWIDLRSGNIIKIWEGDKVENLIVDRKYNQLAFIADDVLWYFKYGAKCPTPFKGSEVVNIEQDLMLGSLKHFSKDGKSLFITLEEHKKVDSTKEIVQVWSYNDVKLQSEQENEIAKSYLAVVHLEDSKIVRLQQTDDVSIDFPTSKNSLDTIALVCQKQRSGEKWNFASKKRWKLISTKNGEVKYITSLPDEVSSIVRISSYGKYLIYYSYDQRSYCSYEIASGITRNLTKNTYVSWINPSSGGARGIQSLMWLENDASVLVYDRNDIWELDPSNKKKPINITNGYGKKHQIIFNYVLKSDVKNIVDNDRKLYLTAFSKENKNNGFFLKQLDKIGDPELLHIGPYLYQTNSGYVPDGSNFSPIKAKNAKMYIVRQMSATDAPNYFITSDFKALVRLSDIQPQKKYNWYTTELHSWKSLDGRNLQGILYKPENFDSNKKYPIIFNYYELRSDGLNAWIKPEALCHGCEIDIPTYVSNGYLVFSSDIYYKVGDPMQGTYDAIVSAANYVSTLPFVNVKRMGLQGCSFGGLQTDYLVTHTNLFAAAVSSSGFTNFISGYGSLIGGSVSQEYFENGQARMGANLWERPDAYIKNSPVFQIDKVTTPLLMMHTKKDDGATAYSDAIQFFTGLRRMGKKAWMLVYSEGSHGLFTKNESNDFSVRMMQFFDHYLKDKPTPVWMLEGVAAKDRNWGAGLELDTKGRTPGPGLLTLGEQHKIDSIMKRKPIHITLK